MLCLAVHGEEAVVSTTAIAEAMEIPYRFLRRIALRLVEKGLVDSVRGKQGGLRLARPSTAISLLDIALTVDPEAVALNQCLLEPDACSRSPYCVVHGELNRVQALVNGELASTSLAMLAARERKRQGLYR
jgi:Rrf2 family protein